MSELNGATVVVEGEPVNVKTSRKKVNTPEAEVRGVILAKVNLGVLREYAAQRTGSTVGTVNSLITKLVDNFEESGEPLVTCESCRGRSPENIGNECPFCGDKDQEEIAAQQALATIDADHRSKLAKKGGKTFDIKEAERAESEFLEYRNKGSSAFWEMGRIAAEIQSNRLWALFKDDKTGKPLFPSFEAYCLTRFGFKATHVFRMTKIAASYSREEAKDQSIRALFAARDLPNSDRQTALNAKNTEKEVQKLKPKKSKGKTPARKPRSDKAATFVFDGATKSVALSVRGEEVKVTGPKRKHLERKPHVVVDGVSDGTKIAFGLVEKGGVLCIRYSISKE